MKRSLKRSKIGPVFGLLSRFAKTTTVQRWTLTCPDLRKGMRWAKTQPHPFKKGKTLWDFVYDKQESTYTIDNLNKFLFNEM
jgi:hypothetical protein